MSDELSLGEHRFTSRLVVGTGKYRDFPTMQKAIVASGAQMVTVAVRRLDLSATGEKSLLHWIPKECVLLPNTAGCFTAHADKFGMFTGSPPTGGTSGPRRASAHRP